MSEPKRVYVTPAQVKAAQLIIQLDAEGGRPTDPAVRAIAEAEKLPETEIDTDVMIQLLFGDDHPADPNLIELLRAMGGIWGPLGVARCAVRLVFPDQMADTVE